MTTAHTTTGKAIEKLGTIAAYSFWLTAALTCAGFLLVLFSYDTPAAYGIGQLFAAVGVLMLLSIGTMVGCVKLLKRRGEY